MRRIGFSAAMFMALWAGVPLHAQQLGQPDADRSQLEQRIRQRIGQVVQARLRLTDDQMRQLGSVEQKYEPTRRALLDQERDIRMGLRDEMMRGDAANQPRVDSLITRIIGVQQKRLDLITQEQQDLSKFMTPVQRAGFLAIQDKVRKRVEEFRQRRGGGGGGGGGIRRP